MKRWTALILIMVSALLLSGYIHKDAGQRIYYTQTLTFPGTATTGNLHADHIGGYLFSYEIKASADDAMTFAVASHLGTVLFTRTTTAATDGEIANPTGYWPINGIPTYALTNFSGTGTVTVEVTTCKR